MAVRQERPNNKRPKRVRGPGIDRQESEAREAETQALNLRRAGANFREIAAAQGCAVSTASDRVKRGLQALRQERNEAAQEVVEMEIMRCDRLLAACWPTATDPAHPKNLRAIQTALKISERRMKILGIEREKVEFSGPDGGPVEIEDSGYAKIQALLKRYAEVKE